MFYCTNVSFFPRMLAADLVRSRDISSRGSLCRNHQIERLPRMIWVRAKSRMFLRVDEMTRVTAQMSAEADEMDRAWRAEHD